MRRGNRCADTQPTIEESYFQMSHENLIYRDINRIDPKVLDGPAGHVGRRHLRHPSAGDQRLGPDAPLDRRDHAGPRRCADRRSPPSRPTATD